jgi:predicted phage terminase large subunit-like protein
MKPSAHAGAIAREWIEFLESWRPPCLPSDPREFITRVLGYEFTAFHEKWWRFAAEHPHSLLLAPRGHGKSTILTVAFTLHRILENPDLRVLIVSNTAAQAVAFLREIRAQLEKNPAIADVHGNLAGQPWNENEISLRSRLIPAKEATVTVMGVMGPVISRHYDVVIMDDVVDEALASGKAMRTKLETWYYKELLPTLEPGGELHVMGTRYHHDDLYGRLIQKGMPVLIERAISGEGEEERALWEEKFSLKLLRDKRDQAGPAIFNAQYQNDVAAMMGQIFRPEWIQTRPAPASSRKFQGVDLAIGQGDHHDYFAHVTIGETAPRCFHVLAVHRARLTFEDQFRAIKSLFTAHDAPDSPVAAVGVEANAYQEAMAQRLRVETMLPVRSVVQTRDKIARAMRLQGLIQTGRLSFPESGAHDLLTELLSFPDGPHDDLVDALEIAVRTGQETSRYGELSFNAPDISP